MLRRIAVILSLSASPALAEGPKLLTDIPPVQSLVSMVTGELPGVILSGADDPHHVQLRPSHVRAMAEADQLIWVGPALTPWLGDEMAAVNSEVTLVTLGGDAGHDWLDPAEAAVWLAQIGKALGLDSAAAVAEMDRLIAEVDAVIDPVRGVRLLADHDAYGAFAARFGLTFVGEIADHDAHEPGAAHLAELHEHVEAGEVDCILVGANEPDDHAEALAHGEVPVVRVDLIGAGLEPGPRLYPDLIRGLAKSLTECVEMD